jgi:hypothetical protein
VALLLLLVVIRPESYEYGTSVSQIGAPPSSWAAPDVTAADATTTSSNSSNRLVMKLDMVDLIVVSINESYG